MHQVLRGLRERGGIFGTLAVQVSQDRPSRWALNCPRSGPKFYDYIMHVLRGPQKDFAKIQSVLMSQTT